MKKNLLEKLKNYSKTAAALAVVGGTANAQIVYTDVDADTTLNTFPSNYEIDFDGDGVIDVNAQVLSNSPYYQGRMQPVGTNTSVVASSTYVAVLNTSDLISISNSFVTSSTYGLNLVSGNTSGSTWGNWNSNIDDKYVGVKFDISGTTHYGWIRVSVAYNDINDFSMTIKDFAYQAIADSAIYAGSVQADTAYTLVATDVDENGNGLDMQIEFNMAANEQFIEEYRVMVVKTADAATFNLDSANAVDAANYTAIAPTGSNISTVLTDLSNDIDGDAIINDVPYKLFVLSVTPDSVLSINNINSLSAESNEITLSFTTDISKIETNINIYPNPVSNILNIRLEKADKYTIKLTNILGEEFIIKEFNSDFTTLDINGLTKGNYILTISNNVSITTKQVVIK